jgi:hypothetical protein
MLNRGVVKARNHDLLASFLDPLLLVIYFPTSLHNLLLQPSSASPSNQFPLPNMSQTPEYVVLGAGVIGLTTALELSSRYSASKITILAKHLPGDSSVEYCSPWAGTNWLSVAMDGERQEGWDRVTYEKFGELADGKGNETGIKRLDIRAWFDREMEEAGFLSVEGEGKGRGGFGLRD